MTERVKKETCKDRIWRFIGFLNVVAKRHPGKGIDSNHFIECNKIKEILIRVITIEMPTCPTAGYMRDIRCADDHDDNTKICVDPR